MGSGKQVSRRAHIGDAGIALTHQRVSAMDQVWHERTVDAGIDGTIELRDPATGEVSNRHLQVQSKASDNDFPGETADRFHYDCDERDLDYWMKSHTRISDQTIFSWCRQDPHRPRRAAMADNQGEV